MQFNFDDAKFDATARVVLKYNEHAAGWTVAELIDDMKAMARAHPNSVCGTRGYYVASSSNDDGTIYAAAFPAPWLIPV